MLKIIQVCYTWLDTILLKIRSFYKLVFNYFAMVILEYFNLE